MGEIGEVMQLLNASRLMAALVIVVLAIVASRLITSTLDRFGEGNARRRLTAKYAASISRFVIFIGAVAFILINVLDLSGETWIALSATIGLTVGFALKDTAASLLSGLLILIDRPFTVGDRISFDKYYGEVREIGLRTVRIATLDDNLVSIPTNKFLTDPVASANAGELDMMVQMDFFIAIDADFELARDLAHEAAVTSKYVFLEKKVNLLVSDEMTPHFYATRIRVQCYVVDCRFERRLASDVTERIKTAWRKHGIRPPFVLEHQVRRSDYVPPSEGRSSSPT